jgi:CheY-like chemotaxis protein
MSQEKDTNYDFLSGKLNVLFVDDDNFYIEQIKKYCEKLSLDFSGFKSRKELNEKIENIKPDLALIDLTLDNDTYCGYKIAKQILDLYPDCYAVVYSNHSAKLEESRVRESGVSKYIEKNMTFEGFCELASKAFKLKDAILKAKNKIIRTIVIDDEEFYLARWKRIHLENVKRFLAPTDFFTYFSEHKDELETYDIIICDYYFNGYDIVSSGFVDELKKTFNYQGLVALCSSFSIGHVDGFDLVLEKKVYSAKELSQIVLKQSKNF